MAEMPLTTITPFRVPSLLIRSLGRGKMGPSHVICCLISQEQINFAAVSLLCDETFLRKNFHVLWGVENLIQQKTFD